MPRALGSNRALRITSWSPSILLPPLAADDVGGRYGEAVPYVFLPRMIAKAMRAILDARHFIGERDGDKLEGLGLHELLRP
jgi:hypothetical protein